MSDFCATTSAQPVSQEKRLSETGRAQLVRLDSVSCLSPINSHIRVMKASGQEAVVLGTRKLLFYIGETHRLRNDSGALKFIP